jgi:hypothetical protein
MGLTLLKPNQTWAQVRILHAESWGSSTATSAAAWLVLPMQMEGQRKHGFELLEFDRSALPFVGRAKFKLEYGRFADGIIAADAGSAESLRSGVPWDASQDQLDISDLRGHEIRIQVRETDDAPWVTAWWGRCEYQEDVGAPGADTPMGTRIYHCVDGLQRAGRWRVSRHGYHDGTLTIANSRGTLGYNVPAEADAIYSKNRSDTTFTTEGGTNALCHTAPGRGDGYWTAQQAVQNALAVARPAGEPLLAFRTDHDLLAGVHCWDVKETDTALDVLQDICRRERGRGCVYLDWTEAGPDGALTVFLNCRPQLILDVVYTDPSTGDEVTIQGAESAGTTINVDLMGDHRVRMVDFHLGDPYQYRFGYLESFGEKLEVAVTLAYVDGQTGSSGEWKGKAITPAWSADEATAFLALTGSNLQRRNVYRFKPVFQLHTLRQDWSGQAGDGNGGASVALQRVDFRCDDDGNVVTPAVADPVDTSPAAVQLLSSLPMFERYDYTGTTPTLYDGDDVVSPTDRRRLMILVRLSANRYLTVDQTGAHVSVASDKNHLWLTHAEDEDAGTRYFSKTSDGTLDAGYDYNKLVVTTGLQLPHRVRMASGDPTSLKRGEIIHSNMHLWLAAPGTIWEIDATVGDPSAGYAAKRRAGNGSLIGGPGVLRDDRGALAAIHSLTWAWYGTDTDRRSASWSLRACGFLPSFTAVEEITDVPTSDDATDILYPNLGQVVNTLGANGEYHIINTPITRIAYDHKSGITTWSSEWSELERER